MPITHANVVTPSDHPWNDAHDHPPFSYLVYCDTATAFVATNLGASVVEIGTVPAGRTKVDLTNATQIAIEGQQNAIASSGSYVRLQYSTDQSAWSYLNAAGSGPSFTLDTTTANVPFRSAFVTIDAGAKADVYLRAVCGGGDSAADPSFSRITAQVL